MCLLPCWGWLSNELLAGRFLDWGVARKRREHINSNQECPPRFTINREGMYESLGVVGFGAGPPAGESPA